MQGKEPWTNPTRNRSAAQ